MPPKPKRPCLHPGCYNLSTEAYCPEHTKRKDTRPTAAQRGYGYKWQQASKGYLAKHPLCVRCEDEGQLTPATVVDHKIPHKGDKVLFWDRRNWQGLCKPHHDRKTAREDGGFGRPFL